MWYNEDKFIVRIGNNTYENVPNIIVYKGDNIFTINRAESTELLGINFDIFDDIGVKVATIKQGRIYNGRKKSYEITINRDQYLLKEKKSGRIICDIKKRILADGVELDITVSLYTKDRFLIDATPEKTNIGGLKITGCHFSNCDSGIVIN